jgi:membrane-bound lytic murein transglycosylase B
MLTRRLLLAAIPAIAAVKAQAASDSFAGFLAGLRAEARRVGISSVTLDRALAGLAPNAKVLERDRHQPEFTMTWAQYRALLITDKRIDAGRAAVRDNRALLSAVRSRFGVGPSVVTGIWGLESSFGTQTGDFHVVDALATLAWDGRRASFFRPELMAALKILDHGDVTPARMTGSYAGAMGQPQFMPTSFLRYAVDFEGDGRRDIWTSRADVLASIANYLAQSGWRDGEAWGQAVALPAGFDTGAAGREARRPLADWARQGVRPVEGRWRATAETTAAVLLPDGAGGEAFVVYPNFGAIRRYNPSDYYALVVGLLGDTLVV